MSNQSVHWWALIGKLLIASADRLPWANIYDVAL